MAVDQVELELRDAGLVGFDLGLVLLDGELLIGDGLLGDGLLRLQLVITGEVGARLIQRGLILQKRACACCRSISYCRGSICARN